MSSIMSTLLIVLPYILFLIGPAMFTIGLTAWIRGTRKFGDSGNRLLGMVRGFRVGIVGLAIVGVGIWLLTRETWILIVSLAVGGEELLESSFIIWALRSDPRRQECVSQQS